MMIPLTLLTNKAAVAVPDGRPPTSRYYMFIICDLTTPPWATLPEGVTYLVCQHERGTRLGNDHLQGYVELTRAQRMSWLHNNLHPTMQLRKRYGSQEQAIDYCTKEDTRVAGPWHFGTPYTRGDKVINKIVQMRDMIREGCNMRDLIEHMPVTLARNLSFAKLCFSYRKPTGNRDIAVFLLYGSTRTGKSRFVVEQYQEADLYIIPFLERKTWFDGYDGEANVLIDDFSGGMPRSQLLRVLDRYRLRVPNKGGFLWWGPIRIYITTNIHPRQWYRDWTLYEEHYNALRERMQAVYDFNIAGPIEDKLVDTNEFFSKAPAQWEIDPRLSIYRTPLGVSRSHSSSSLGKRKLWSGYDPSWI